MKIEFSDKSYIEINRSMEPGKVFVIISARDSKNHLTNIVNAVEITEEQLAELVASVKV
jgi:phosphosulfolactate synthase (CoM biosynthesis protein A)